MLGVMSSRDAYFAAQKKGLDLVEISPTATPPVCKIMDFGKYKYELQKKAHDARKNQKIVKLKEVKLRPNIAEGDYSIKMRNAEKFLKEGNKVKVIMVFRGREVTHSEVGLAIVHRFRDDLELLAKADNYPKLEGKQILLILSPKQ